MNKVTIRNGAWKDAKEPSRELCHNSGLEACPAQDSTPPTTSQRFWECTVWTYFVSSSGNPNMEYIAGRRINEVMQRKDRSIQGQLKNLIFQCLYISVVVFERQSYVLT